MEKITRRAFAAFAAMLAALGHLVLRLSPKRYAYHIDLTEAEGAMEPVLVQVTSVDFQAGISTVWDLMIDRKSHYVMSSEVAHRSLVDPLLVDPLPRGARRFTGPLHVEVERAAAEYKARYVDGNEALPEEATFGRGDYRWGQSCYEAEELAKTKLRPMNATERRVLAELQSLRFEPDSTRFRWRVLQHVTTV